jgi:3-hydroxyacyl-[acyl-carrier-protein] dehydratase
LDNAVLQSLIRAGKRAPLWERGPHTQAADIGRDAIERMLEHRDPFLFVDKIEAVDLEQGAVRGERTIDPADPLFRGHFPGQPLYPGVLQLEIMGQFGLCLLHLSRSGSAAVAPDASPAAVRALKIHHALFLREVLPGDRLTVLARMVECDEYTGICSGQVLRDGEVCSFAVMEVYFVN